jgi:hypothetical protein
MTVVDCAKTAGEIMQIKDKMIDAFIEYLNDCLRATEEESRSGTKLRKKKTPRRDQNR